MGWFELPEEDQPPRDIWLNDEALEEHFAAVKRRWGSNSSTSVEDVDMDQNEYTKSLRR